MRRAKTSFTEGDYVLTTEGGREIKVHLTKTSAKYMFRHFHEIGFSGVRLVEEGEKVIREDRKELSLTLREAEYVNAGLRSMIGHYDKVIKTTSESSKAVVEGWKQEIINIIDRLTNVFRG